MALMLSSPFSGTTESLKLSLRPWKSASSILNPRTSTSLSRSEHWNFREVFWHFKSPTSLWQNFRAFCSPSIWSVLYLTASSVWSALVYLSSYSPVSSSSLYLVLFYSFLAFLAWRFSGVFREEAHSSLSLDGHAHEWISSTLILSLITKFPCFLQSVKSSLLCLLTVF